MLTCCALDDRERARYLARELIAFYLGAMGTFYREALARQGHEATATTVATRWANGEREAAIDGVDAVSVGFPRIAEHAEMVQTVEALAPR